MKFFDAEHADFRGIFISALFREILCVPRQKHPNFCDYTSHRYKLVLFPCVLCASFAFLAVKNFYRKGRRDLRKVRKEKCQAMPAKV